MKPERTAQTALSITRSKAKMFEYGVPLEEHIALKLPPDSLFSLAIGLLGNAAAALAAGDSDDPLRETSQDSVRFSANFFDAFIETRLDETLTIECSLLAASAYYLADLPGSAAVVIKNMNEPSVSADGDLPCLLYRILHRDIDRSSDDLSAESRNILKALRSFFEVNGSEQALVDLLRDVRKRMYEFGGSRDLLYADLVVAITQRMLSNSTRLLLPLASGLSLEQWSPALTKAGFPRELWPAQRKLCDAGLLSGRSAVIQMPTSAGKTRASEIIIRSAFLGGRTSLAVIVAPFRALCHDIRSDLSKAFSGEDISIAEATDSYSPDIFADEVSQDNVVLILTPEKLLYLLRRDSSLAAQIGLIIYDEGHLFDSGSRGITYELLLASLNILVPPTAQIVLISAVIANAGHIAAWLIGDESSVVSGAGLLPTARSIAFWTEARGQLKYVSPADPDQEEFFVPRVMERTTIREGSGATSRTFPSATGTEIGLSIALKLVKNGSVAIFCGRKDAAAKLLTTAADLVGELADDGGPATLSDAEELNRIAALSAAHLGVASPAARAARTGVLIHHGSVPHGLRLAAEHAMKEGLAKLVICTSTLAQGVNLPIRYLIITSVQQGRDRVSVRDFHNLIGRAGRAGMYTEGSVIFADPAVFDRRGAGRSGAAWRNTKALLDYRNAEPCTSMLRSLFEPFRYGVRRELSPPADLICSLVFNDTASVEQEIARAIALDDTIRPREYRRFLQEKARTVQAVAAYLLSHVEFESEDAKSEIRDLARNTLAHSIGSETDREILALAFDAIFECVQEQMPTDDVRSALQRTSLPPAVTTGLKEWIEGNRDTLAGTADDDTLYAIVSAELLARVRSESLDALSKPEVIPILAQAWLSGAPFSDLLQILTGSDVRTGGNNRRPTLETAVAIGEAGFGYDCATLLASMADIAEKFAPELYNRLSSLHRRMKYGLPNDTAVAFYEIGFADRVIALELANGFPSANGRASARNFIRQDTARAHATLALYPAYYKKVVEEIART